MLNFNAKMQDIRKYTFSIYLSLFSGPFQQLAPSISATQTLRRTHFEIHTYIHTYVCYIWLKLLHTRVCGEF